MKGIYFPKENGELDTANQIYTKQFPMDATPCVQQKTHMKGKSSTAATIIITETAGRRASVVLPCPNANC